jgi:hypothetical protein
VVTGVLLTEEAGVSCGIWSGLKWYSNTFHCEYCCCPLSLIPPMLTAHSWFSYHACCVILTLKNISLSWTIYS